MPIDYKDYHPKWKLISRLIRFVRAKNRCEKCGIPNSAVIKREKGDAFRYPCQQEWDMIKSAIRYSGYSFAGALKKFGFTKIVLTVAHIDGDKTNNRFWNLAAWCQRCHLKHDIKQHVANRKYGRNHKKFNYKMDL